MDVGKFVLKNRKKGMVLILIITIIFLSIIYFKGIDYQFDEKGFFPENEVVKTNERIRNEYTNEYLVPLLVISKDGNILNKDDLIEILQVEEKIYVAMNVTPLSIADVISSSFLSLNNISDQSYENKIKMMNIVKNEDIQKLIQFPFFPKKYISLLLSKDFNGKDANATIISILLNGSLLENEERATENESIIYEIAEGEHGNIKISVLGGATIIDRIMKENTRSLSILLPLSFLLLIAVLVFIYRNLKDVLMSLMGLCLVIIWMIGLGSLLNYSFDPLITSIPVLMVGLGIDYSIHIKKRMDEEENERRAINSIFLSLLLSAITTSIAFLSNISSSIPTLQHFGIMSSFAILSCLFIMLFLMSYRTSNKRKDKKIAKRVAIYVNKFRKGIVISAILITILLSYSATTIRAEFNITNFLPEKMEISQDIKYLINNFEAAEGEEAVIVIHGNITDPEMLLKIHEVEKNVEDDKYVAEYGVTSIISLMQDYATKTLYDIRYNETFEKKYELYFENGLPRENTEWREIKELYDLLYTISPSDIRRILHAGDGYDETLIRISTNTGKEEKNVTFLYNELRNDAKYIPGAIVSGGIITGYVVLKALRNSQMESLSITLFLSFFILTLVFYRIGKSLSIGIISTIPVIFSAIWIIGTMAILDIPLTITTITVASLAVGLGIDYSIHMTHRFIEERDAERVMRSTGSALLGSALTTIAAFGLLSLSFLPPLKMFGISISIAIFYSFISCVFILPAILEIRQSSKFFQ